MSSHRPRRPQRPYLPLLVGLVLVVAACQTQATAETTSTTVRRATTTTTTTTAPETTTTTTQPEPFEYRVGLTSPPTTDNFWAAFDPQSGLVDQYLLEPTKPSLYTHVPPGMELAPDLAAGPEVADPVEAGDGTWTVTVGLRPDAEWSDGTPITAEDIVFTFETARDLRLGGGWTGAYPVHAEGSEVVGLVAVEAVDRSTVRYRFSAKPGLPVWPNGPGTAPIMPRHHWEDVVAEALQAADPVGMLTESSGQGEPSGGATLLTHLSEAGATAVPNPRFHRLGEEVTSGGVGYEVGPFFDRMTFTVFPDQNAALEGLAGDAVDIILEPTGLDRRGARFAEEAPGIATVTNPTTSFRYLGFNLRRPPMSSDAFRDAVDLMVDRRFVADQMLHGEAFPAWATVSPADPVWYDAEAAAALEEPTGHLSAEARLAAAVDVLEEGGFTWERPPAFRDNVVIPGSPVSLDGQEVPALEIVAPGPAFDPERATYALWLEEWIEQLGFTVDVEMSGFEGVVQRVFTPDESGEDIDFDMYVLGWRLPGPGMPVYHGSFWSTAGDTLLDGGNNNTGFSDEAFDDLVAEYHAATTVEDARRVLWEMEAVLAAEKPYLVLFDTGITEAYRTDRVVYPFTDVVGGIQLLAGMPELVQAAS